MHAVRYLTLRLERRHQLLINVLVMNVKVDVANSYASR